MRSAIVFGASGFIGNALARQLIKENVEVLAVVRPDVAERPEKVRLEHFEARVIRCDLRSGAELKRFGVTADVFYNCAWEGTDALGIVDWRTQTDNIRWGLEMIDAAAALGCGRYVGLGSISQMELLTVADRFCVAERHRYYRAAQDCCENMGRALAKDLGIEFVWPVLINVYGEDAVAQRFINRFVHNVLHHVEMPLSSGEQYYDFLHMDDAASALYAVGYKPICSDRCIVGSGTCRRLKDYLIEARNLLNPGYQLNFGKPDENEIRLPKEYLNTSAFCTSYGFHPSVDFQSGIMRLKEWEKTYNGE